jgi:Secretion system C-terminal sorting domain
MKNKILKIIKGACLLIGLLMLSCIGFSQEHITLSLENIATTSNTIEYDLVIINDGNTNLKLAACAYGVNYSDSILNGSNLSENEYTLIPGTQSQELIRLTTYSLKQTHAGDMSQLRLTMAPVSKEHSIVLLARVPYKVGRFEFTNSKPWTRNSNPAFSLNEFNVVGMSTSCAVAYVDDAIHCKGFSTALKNLTCRVDNSPVLNPTTTADNAQIYGSLRTNNTKAIKVLKQNINGEADIKVSIYPNPTQEILHVAFQVSQAVTTLVKVSDISGRVVKQVQARSEKGYNSMNISLGEVSSGMYTVQVYQDEKLTFVDKVNKKD